MRKGLDEILTIQVDSTRKALVRVSPRTKALLFLRDRTNKIRRRDASSFLYCKRVRSRLRLHIPLKRDDPVALDGGIAGISLHDKTVQILDVKILFSFSIIKFEGDVIIRTG